MPLTNYKTLKIDRETFGKIFNDLKTQRKTFYELKDIYDNIQKNKMHSSYSYKDFYCACMIFEELGLINYGKIDNLIFIKINKDVKSDLANSLILKKIKKYMNREAK